MYEPLQKYLNKAAAEYNFTKQLTAIQICQEYRRLSKTVLPPNVAEQTFPKSYDHQILTVGVANSALAQQLAMHKHHIVESINQKYGKNTVKNLKVEMTAPQDPDNPEAFQ